LGIALRHSLPITRRLAARWNASTRPSNAGSPSNQRPQRGRAARPAGPLRRLRQPPPPHRALGRRTPAGAYAARPKATPAPPGFAVPAHWVRAPGLVHRSWEVSRRESALCSGGPERSWATWSPSRRRSAWRVLRGRCRCPLASGGPGSLTAQRPTLGLAGSSPFPVLWWSRVTPGRRRAANPRPRLPITTAAA